MYPYPRVYPTRPVLAGTGRVGSGRVNASRVRVGSGRCFTGTGIPAFTREKKFLNHTITNNLKLTKSRILSQFLMKSMLIPLQFSTLRTGTTNLWLSGSRIALASRNWRSLLEVSVRFRRHRTRANERSVQLDT